MKSFYLTDSGKVRDHNEDSVTIVKNKNGEVLMAVADGMGGHKAGEVASSIAISHLGKRFADISSVGNKQDAISWLKDTVNEVNALIFKYTNEHVESVGMGTTLVCALITEEFILIGNIGDSSGFVVKDGKLHKITQDHTLVNLLVKSGELTEEEAVHHPKKNVLMKALGANEIVELDIFDVEKELEGILLCSDGLTNMLTQEQICKVIMDEELEIEDKIIKLIRKSNARGGLDNISVAYLEKESGEDSDN